MVLGFVDGMAGGWSVWRFGWDYPLAVRYPDCRLSGEGICSPKLLQGRLAVERYDRRRGEGFGGDAAKEGELYRLKVELSR
jgi:hypothetical protein